jgi:uncharacterized membrane protein
MADEVKKEDKGAGAKKALSTVIKVLLGLVFLLAAGYLLISLEWWKESWIMVKGCLGPFLILAGLITLAIAKE